MTDHKHYIIDKHTHEIQHGPFPDAAAASHAADNFEWFDNDQHEIVAGTIAMHDEHESEDHGSHGWFIMKKGCDEPIAGPFETQDEAASKDYSWLHGAVEHVEGMISNNGKFYPH